MAVLGILSIVFFGLELYRKPRFIQNFEEEEYGREHPFLEPVSVVEGLAVYATGQGEPVLLCQLPHHGGVTDLLVRCQMALAWHVSKKF